MAWLTREDARAYSRTPRNPDMETLSYWLARLEPLIRAEGEEEIISVFANRSGVEEEAVYAGTSAVLGIQDGEVRVYGILGRGEREVLIVDTSKRPQMMLVSEPRSKEKEKRGRRPLVETPPLKSSASSGSTFNSSSGRSFDSNLSIDTGNTSIESTGLVPPIDSVALTPTSPEDQPQSFFAIGREPRSQKCAPSPGPRKPTPTPNIPRGQTPSAEHNRKPTPTPVTNFNQQVASSPYSPTFHRPCSPKSRNTSRTGQRNTSRAAQRPESRSKNQRDLAPFDIESAEESPLLGKFDLASRPALKDDEEIARILQDINDEDEIIGIIDESDTRGDADDEDSEALILDGDETVEDVDEKVKRMQDSMLPTRADTAKTRPSNSTSLNPQEWDSNFTKNTLGPRSRHISPRPKSTIW